MKLFMLFKRIIEFILPLIEQQVSLKQKNLSNRRFFSGRIKHSSEKCFPEIALPFKILDIQREREALQKIANAIKSVSKKKKKS